MTLKTAMESANKREWTQMRQQLKAMSSRTVSPTG